jgi:hypothetical protein
MAVRNVKALHPYVPQVQEFYDSPPLMDFMPAARAVEPTLFDRMAESVATGTAELRIENAVVTPDGGMRPGRRRKKVHEPMDESAFGVFDPDLYNPAEDEDLAASLLSAVSTLPEDVGPAIQPLVNSLEPSNDMIARLGYPGPPDGGLRDYVRRIVKNTKVQRGS